MPKEGQGLRTLFKVTRPGLMGWVELDLITIKFSIVLDFITLDYQHLASYHSKDALSRMRYKCV